MQQTATDDLNELARRYQSLRRRRAQLDAEARALHQDLAALHAAGGCSYGQVAATFGISRTRAAQLILRGQA